MKSRPIRKTSRQGKKPSPGGRRSRKEEGSRSAASPPEVTPSRAAAYEALMALDRGSTVSETLLQSVARKNLNDKDAALVREIVYGVTRMRRRLDHVIASLCERPFLRLSLPVRTALRMGTYQMLFLDSVPAHAAVHESVGLVKRAGDLQAAGFTNAVLRSVAEKRPLPEPEAGSPLSTLALRHSHPDWLVERWAARFGTEDLQALLNADNRPHSLFMRVKPGMRATVVGALRAEGYSIEEAPWPPDTFVLSGRGAGLFESESFLRGDWIVQDWTPQAMLELAPLQEGMRVWDVCAAPGGKSVGLAWRVGDAGAVLASDPSPTRLKLLRDNLRRTGIRNVRVHEGGVGNLPGAEKFHLVWVDAPCTGSGVLSRRADLRWRLGPGDVKRMAIRQAALLSEVQRRVYPGGFLLYSTCSLEPEENGDVIAGFLEKHPPFKPWPTGVPDGFPEVREEAGGLLFLPTERHDGGFWAVLRREPE